MSSQHGHGSNILKAGDYKIEKFVMHSLVNGSFVDLVSLYRKIELYEDIFSPYITGKILIEDAYNFPEKFPVIGQEKIELTLKSDIDDLPNIELVLRVYKLDSHRLGETGKVQQYVLHIMSEGGYFNHSEYCGYHVSGPVSEMVKMVFSKHFPETVWKDRLDVEDTKDNYSFVLSGSYTPFKSINWLTSKAYTTSTEEYSPFMFYETLAGHRFKSMSKIIEDGSARIPKYLYNTGNMKVLPNEQARTDPSKIGDSPLPVTYHKVQQLEELERFDMANNILNGIVSSRLMVHDLLRKEHRTHDFFENQIFPKMKKLGEFSHFRETDPEAQRLLKKGAAFFYLPSTPYTVHNKVNGILDNTKVESLYLKRKYHMNTFLTQKLVIEVFGDSRRSVGDVVELSVPKVQSDSSFQSDYDKNLSGEYLVTGLKHIFTDTYRVKMELSRNCMGV
jgi:hypothetical protein